MDGRGGCCIARYDGGVNDMSKVDRIMLRFRPIAPKPAAGGSASPPENNENYSKSGRGKRRSSRENNNNNYSGNGAKRCNRKKRVSNEETTNLNGEQGVTLPLLPNTPASNGTRNCSPESISPVERKRAQKAEQVWLNFVQTDPNQRVTFGMSADRTAAMTRPHATKVVGSCVTVERVTDTWVDGDGLGSTDEERKANLAKDTCPGFLSDGFKRVTWTNGAFREMVGGRWDSGDAAEMTVWLVMRERPMVTYPAFTCRVRVQYGYCGKERSSLTLPCDVWRMDDGGLAWRLDLKAALCLGQL